MSVDFSGGYTLIDEPLVRGYGPNSHTAADMSGISDYAVEAVNLIQETPWKINRFILDTVLALTEEAEATGTNIGYDKNGQFETVVMVQKPTNPRDNPLSPVNYKFSPEHWKAMDAKTKRQFKLARAKEYEVYKSLMGVYRATRRLVEMAIDMRNFPKFYFPHNMDFRTRIYPIPTDLNPQSNDLSKGLLAFARGTRLGHDGVYWLAVTVATQYGEDKLSMDDRVAFASDPEFMRKCELWVDDPVTNRGWLEADCPFQFLAVAFEWVWANRNPDGSEAFVSFLPGNLDGSCNGAQHLSILSRDLVGATATNCRNLPVRGDLYMSVGDKVWEQVQADAEKGDPVAIEWVPKLLNPSARRKVVKRSVMTVPYGVTEFGVAEFMLKDGHVDGAENQWDSARYLRDKIMVAIEGMMVRGRELQRYFQACATICAEAGKALIWDTPAGSKVTQAYRNVIEKRIKTFDTRFVIYAEPSEDEDPAAFYSRIGMNVKKMGTSAPPNVVHSCDASHLQITTVRMGQAGIKDFSMIHDSYGCPMAHVGLMRDILRQAIVDMYADNYLERWRQSVERYSGLKMPDPPELGEFDLNEILKSEFFFS